MKTRKYIFLFLQKFVNFVHKSRTTFLRNKDVKKSNLTYCVEKIKKVYIYLITLQYAKAYVSRQNRPSESFTGQLSRHLAQIRLYRNVI